MIPLDHVFRLLTGALREQGIRASWAAPTLAGHLVVALEAPTGAWRAVVSPRPPRSSSGLRSRAGDLHLRGIGSATVPTPEDFQAFVASWNRIVQGELGRFLDLHNREVTEVDPTPSGLLRLVAWMVRPGSPLVAGWKMGDVRRAPGPRPRLLLDATREGREGAGVLLALDPEGPEDPREEVLATLPLGFLVRPIQQAEQGQDRDRILAESALSWTLAMSMPASLRWGPWPVLDAPTSRPPPRRQDDTLIVHSYRTDHEWHVPRSRFFGTWGDKDWFILLALLDRPTLNVFHGNRECQQVRQPLSDRFAHGANPFHPSRRHWSWMVSHTRFTDTDDRAAVFGGEDRLQGLLDRIDAESPGREVRVLVGCDAEVVGDDVPRVCRMARSEGRNVACFNPPLPRFTDAADRNWWLQFLQDRDRTVAPEEGAVNLGGFQWPEHPAMAETEALLARAGVRVACRMLPGHRPDLRTSVGSGQVTILSPWFPVQEVLGSALATEGLPVRTLPLPYGEKPTRSWLAATAEAAGREPLSDASWDEATKPWITDLQEMRARAGTVRVVLAADWGTATEMCDPAFFFGLDPLAMLADLGFPVVVMGREASGAVERARREWPGARLEAIDLDPAVEDVETRLREVGPDLVYCDRDDAAAVKAAGAVPFGIGDLEPGLAGAVRTLRRLLARAGLRLYRRYGPWL